MVLSMEIRFLCHLIMPYFSCPPCVYKKIIIFILNHRHQNMKKVSDFLKASL